MILWGSQPSFTSPSQSAAITLSPGLASGTKSQRVSRLMGSVYSPLLRKTPSMVVTPIRERIIDIENNDEYLRKVAAMGAEKARARAAETLTEVRRIMGFKSF